MLTLYSWPKSVSSEPAGLFSGRFALIARLGKGPRFRGTRLEGKLSVSGHFFPEAPSAAQTTAKRGGFGHVGARQATAHSIKRGGPYLGYQPGNAHGRACADAHSPAPPSLLLARRRAIERIAALGGKSFSADHASAPFGRPPASCAELSVVDRLPTKQARQT